MTNPYRAMCAELHAAFNTYAVDMKHHDLLERARALLDQPAAEGPTDEELLASVRHFYGDQTAADMGAKDDLRTARAVLAKWGRPTPQPVAVSERLPSAADCDAEGNCWWFDPHADGARYVDTFQSCYTYWLPASALPTPEAKP